MKFLLLLAAPTLAVPNPNHFPTVMQQAAKDQLRVGMLSPGTTGTHSIFYALCTLGLPSTHWARSCSTYAPIIGTSKQCIFDHKGMDHDTQIANFPYATRLMELAQELDECVKHVRPLDGANDQGLPSRCQIGFWTSAFRSAIYNFHGSFNSSGVDTPFHMPSVYLREELRPSYYDNWLFVYSHRDANEWAKDRIKRHGASSMCDIRKPQLANINQHDLSPLDQYACLRYCMSEGIASQSDTLGRCLVSINDVGAPLAAKAFNQHTKVALKTAPAPVLELNIFDGPEMSAGELVSTVHQFVEKHHAYVPCEHGHDTAPVASLRIEEDDDAEIEVAEKTMAELADLRKQITNYFVLGSTPTPGVDGAQEIIPAAETRDAASATRARDTSGVN